MSRPRIGITTSYSEGRQALDVYYVRAIEAADGLPLIVPVFENDEAAREFTALLDGLVITGGPGISKGLIGDLPADLEPVDPARDENDMCVFEAMPDKPVLGICYGMQFINAQAGGTIYADVYAQKPGVLLHSAGRGAADHTVHFESGSHIRQALGAAEIIANTYHIQAVNEIGAGLQAVGFGPDGVVEAIESRDGRLIGVQFHPERMFDRTRPLFEDFVNRCRTAT